MVESDAGNLAASERTHQLAIKVSGGDCWVRVFSEAALDKAKGDIPAIRAILRKLENDPR